MLQSRLISLFRNFSKEEFKRFEVFLLSPYFNQSDKLIRFFRLIEPHYPLFESKKLQKEKIYSALHTGSEYNDLTMRKLISDLFKLAKAFVAQEGYMNDDLQAGVYQYRWLSSHSMGKMLDAELDSRRALLDGYVVHDDHYYHHRWLFDLHRYKVLSDRRKGAEHKLLKDFDFWAPVHAHNRNYLVNCFWLYTFMLTIEKIYNFPMDESLMNQVGILAPQYINKGDTVIDMFYRIFQLVRTDEEKYFFELKEQILQDDPSVPFLLRREACVAMENFCIHRIRKGEERLSAEVMSIYRIEVEQELFLENGKMEVIYYFNVALRGAESGEADWADHFIEKYKMYLPDDVRDDSYMYAKAHILCAQRKFKEALRLALSCRISYFIGRITTRVLVARIQYELGMLDEIQVELDSSRHQIRDEKLPDDLRQFFQSFFSTMKLLCELKGDYTREKRLHLVDHIQGQKSTPGKKWFFEKIKELEIAHGEA